MDYSTVILNVIDKLIPLSKSSNILNEKIIKNYIKIEMQKEKIPTSIVGIKLASEEASGVIDLYKSFFKTINKIKTIEKKLNDPKNAANFKELGEEKNSIEKMKDELYNAIEIQMEEYKTMKELKERYNEHWVKKEV
jgi:predicted  nucleic acid-binding Zn-ribbon protein